MPTIRDIHFYFTMLSAWAREHGLPTPAVPPVGHEQHEDMSLVFPQTEAQPYRVYGGPLYPGMHVPIACRGAFDIARDAFRTQNRIVLPASVRDEVSVFRSTGMIGFYERPEDLLEPIKFVPEPYAGHDWSSSARSEPLLPGPACRALEAAIDAVHSGAKYLHFIGRPGGGKTLVARRVRDEIRRVPDLTDIEDGACAASWGGLVPRPCPPDWWTVPAFRAPHHTASGMGLFGSSGRPGEVHIATGGVLFLDELPEFQRQTIRDVYEAVERGRTYGCRLPVRPRVVITATNPCPCGFHDVPTLATRCRCGADRIAYWKKRTDEMTAPGAVVIDWRTL